MVVTFYEVKNWTLDLRTTRMLPLLTGYLPRVLMPTGIQEQWKWFHHYI